MVPGPVLAVHRERSRSGLLQRQAEACFCAVGGGGKPRILRLPARTAGAGERNFYARCRKTGPVREGCPSLCSAIRR